jgi:pectinesterase
MHPELNIDTGYTIYSALKKHQKKYPNISIANYHLKTPVKEHRNLVYHNYGNRAMHLDLFEPIKKLKKNKPCMVIVHGGGWSTGDKSLLEPFALSLADIGYVTITVEYRFSKEAIYPAAVIDIKTALKWVLANAKKYKIDTNKIAIMGSSAGAQLATLVGLTSQMDIYNNSINYKDQNPKINAIINLDGVLAFIHPISKEGAMPNSSAEKWFGVHYSTDSTKWIEASPLTYVGTNTPPTLFIASSFPRFHAGREEMIEIMNKHNIYNEKYVFKDAPHSYWLFNPWFEPTLTHVVNFLEKVNSQ